MYCARACRALLGERLTLFSSYSELKALTSQHDNLFMAFVVNTSSYGKWI